MGLFSREKWIIYNRMRLSKNISKFLMNFRILLIIILILSFLLIFFVSTTYDNTTMENTFTKVYETNKWGDNKNPEYKGSSGSGSSVDYQKDTYVPMLKKFIIDKNINSVVDLGCGDFLVGKLIYDDIDIRYTGYDTYKQVIDYNTQKYPIPKYIFVHLDFCNNKEIIKNGDLCILKDVLMHWSLQNIYTFLDYIVENKKFNYILICNCSSQTEDNTDIKNGDFRPLSCDYLPLKKYSPVKIYKWDTKEVSIIYTK